MNCFTSHGSHNFNACCLKDEEFAKKKIDKKSRMFLKHNLNWICNTLSFFVVLKSNRQKFNYARQSREKLNKLKISVTAIYHKKIYFDGKPLRKSHLIQFSNGIFTQKIFLIRFSEFFPHKKRHIKKITRVYVYELYTRLE